MKKKLKVFNWIVLFLSVVSCREQSVVRNLTIVEDSENVLRKHIVFNTEVNSTAFVNFWKLESGDSIRSITSHNTQSHTIPLVNMEEDSDYRFNVEIRYEEFTLVSEVFRFSTKSLSQSLPEIEVVVDSGNIFEGFILIRPFYHPGSQIILNNKGKIIWYESFEESIFRPFSWTSDNTILTLRDTSNIEEIDLLGNKVLALSYGQNQYDKYLHHEIFKDTDDHLVSLSRTSKVVDLTKYGGSKQDTINGDGILILNSEGSKVWEWNMFDVIDPTKDPNILETKGDWSHGNAIGVDKDGNFLISFKNFNQIWKVNAKSGELIWKLGKGGDFEMSDSSYFIAQHAVHINEDGHLMLFDNGDNDRPFTRIISFDLDEEKKIATQILNVRLPHHLLTYRMGSAYQISSDKFLVSSPRKQGLISIVNLNGEVLWEVRLSRASYRAVYLNKAELNPYSTCINY